MVWAGVDIDRKTAAVPRLPARHHKARPGRTAIFAPAAAQSGRRRNVNAIEQIANSYLTGFGYLSYQVHLHNDRASTMVVWRTTLENKALVGEPWGWAPKPSPATWLFAGRQNRGPVQTRQSNNPAKLNNSTYITSFPSFFDPIKIYMFVNLLLWSTVKPSMDPCLILMLAFLKECPPHQQPSGPAANRWFFSLTCLRSLTTLSSSPTAKASSPSSPTLPHFK